MKLLFSPLILFISDTRRDYYQNQHHTVLPADATARLPLVVEPPFPNGPCGGRVVSVEVNGNNNAMLLQQRRRVVIDVWLPREYDDDDNNNQDNDAVKFPILFCHDGQNVMDDACSWTGMSWRLIGALTRLYEANSDVLRYPHHPPIVVMLPSAEGDFVLPGIRRRHLEYSDTSNPFGQYHVDFVAHTVLPYIRNNFRRVSHDACDTFTIGSSLGGQASLHLLLRHPNLFGGAACLSPAFQFPTLATVATAQPDKLREKRIYLDIGGDMDNVKVPWFDIHDHDIMSGTRDSNWWNPGYWWLDTQLQPSVNAMSWALTRNGIQHKYRKFPGCRHNERAWSLRIHHPLLYLLGKE